MVTGGGSGWGLATARLFFAEGACVAIAGRDVAKLKQAAAGIPGGDGILIVPTDVTDPGQVHALAGCLANEELESGIRVSSIYPGAIDTLQRLTRPTADTADQQAKMMKPEDVANAVLIVATLPPHVSVTGLIIRPTAQAYI